MRPARFLVVACGGAAGAAARWGVTETPGANTGGFDWTLVAVNTVGSFLLGLVMVAASDGRREHGGAAVGLLSGAADPVATVVGAGGLGALTTFSTVADDLRNLWATSTAMAAAYVATTLILGIGAAAAGLAAVS